MKCFLLSLILCCCFISNSAQVVFPAANDSIRFPLDSTSKIYIQAVIVSGNKKTKTYIIERESLLRAGDSILAREIMDLLTKTQHLIYNTNLFTEVKVQPVFINAATLDLHIYLKEKWFIYPAPQFQLVDRNFNEWIKVYNASLSRVIYGVKFAHYNFSGRRDPLRIYLLNGYARNFSFSYTSPYSNSRLSEGFSVFSGFTQNREVAVRTTYGGKLVQYNDHRKFVRNVFSIGASYSRRSQFFSQQAISISYTHMSVDDSVVQHFNPSYFNSSSRKANIIDLRYTYSYLDVNNINYPLKGKSFLFSVSKRGWGFSGGLNMLSVDLGANRYWSHGKNWHSIIQSAAKVKLPFKQAYINQAALGVKDFNLRGLEYYVIDGVAMGLVKYSLVKKLFSFKIPIPIKNKIVPFIPFTFYAKTFADAGYVYNQQASFLNNRMLYTGGIGIDVLTLYDFNLRFEYSFNQFNQNGLFLHSKGGF